MNAKFFSNATKSIVQHRAILHVADLSVLENWVVDEIKGIGSFLLSVTMTSILYW
jgi:hypothetical protein